jgi:hypothetical protein
VARCSVANVQEQEKQADVVMLPKIGDTIVLSEADQAICLQLAQERYQNNRNHGITNKKIGRQSNKDTDLEGIAGEFAFCRISGLLPDTTVHIRSYLSDSGDVVYAGIKIDIKTTKYANGRLLVPTWKAEQSAHLYALMTGEFPSYEFRGFIKAKDIIRRDHVVDLGYGNTFAANQKELRNVEDLVKQG